MRNVRSHEMKTTILILAMAAMIAGCSPAPTTPIPSPSGKYLVHATINREKSDRTKYLCVRLILTRLTGETITETQTGASHVHKWAIGWMTNQDVIILQSSDIGTHAYEITTNETVSDIPVTPEMENRAQLLKKEKYN